MNELFTVIGYLFSALCSLAVIAFGVVYTVEWWVSHLGGVREIFRIKLRSEKSIELLKQLLDAVDADSGHEPSVSVLARQAEEVRGFLNQNETR